MAGEGGGVGGRGEREEEEEEEEEKEEERVALKSAPCVPVCAVRLGLWAAFYFLCRQFPTGLPPCCSEARPALVGMVSCAVLDYVCQH